MNENCSLKSAVLALGTTKRSGESESATEVVVDRGHFGLSVILWVPFFPLQLYLDG